MCVHINYAYSILSIFQEKLETLVKSSWVRVILPVTIVLVYKRIRKKIVLIHTNTSTFIQTCIHKRHLLAFYLYIFTIFGLFYVQIYSNTVKPTYTIHFLQCKRPKQIFAKNCQLSAKSSTQFSKFFHL